MRLGYLGRLGEMNVNGHTAPFPELLTQQQQHRPSQQSQQHPLGGPGQQQQSVPNSQAGTYSWLSQNDLHLPSMSSSVSHGGSSGMMGEPIHKNMVVPKRETDDVDVMSSDSSSSSSSDSQ